MEVRDLRELQTPVQPYRGRVVCIDSRDENMLIQSRGPGYESLEQLTTQPLAAPIRPNMYRVFDGISIARPRPKVTK